MKPTEKSIDKQQTPAPTQIAQLALSDSDLRQFSALLGVQIRSTADLLREVESMSRISVDGVEVKLQPEVLRRFMSRNIGGMSAEKYVQQKVSELIGEWCGW